MTRRITKTRLLMLVLTAAIAAPVAVTLTASDAQAGGYILAYGADDNVVCNPGGEDVCA